MKNTKAKLISSVAVLLICFAMLIGSTFAWFTDSASTGVNKIQAGNLDVELSVKNKENGNWAEVTENTKLFCIEDDTKWEPGVIAYETLKVKNAGNLALDYTLGFLPVNVTNVDGKSLLDVIKVYSGTKQQINTASRESVLSSISSLPSTKINQYSKMVENVNPGTEDEIVIVLYWEPTENDNNYNLSGNHLKADLGIELVAKQANVESDSFDNNYDKDSLYPIHTSVPVEVDTSNNTVFSNTSASTFAKVADTNIPVASVTIPSGVAVLSGTTELKLTVEETTAPENLVVSDTQNSKTYEVKVVGVDNENNETKLTVQLYVGTNLNGVTVSHNGVAMDSGDYTYNSNSGFITIETKTFSKFTVLYDLAKWKDQITDAQDLVPNGEVYYISNAKELAVFARMVNQGETFEDKTIQLTSNIDLGEYLWTPIGINTNGSWFKGTFDGDGHSISNIYCDNPNYGGLFGYIGTGTITNTTFKNLNINNVNLTNGGNIDGECAGGALVGWIENHIDGSTITIENVTVTGIKADGYKYTGGLIGFKDAEATLNIKKVSVIGTDTMNTLNSSYNENGDYKGHVGGLIGRVATSGEITNCTISDINISRGGITTSGNRAGSVIGSTSGSVNVISINVRKCTVLGEIVTDNSTAIGTNSSNTNIEGITVSNS